MEPTTPCELCKGAASLYCASDSAFLCHNCDALVHRANFLVARHLRHSLCSNCSAPTANCFIGSTATPTSRSTLCVSCSECNLSHHAHPDLHSLSSSSSACISTTETSAATHNKKICSRVHGAPESKAGVSSSLTDISGEISSSATDARFHEATAAAFSGEVTSGKRGANRVGDREYKRWRFREARIIDPKSVEEGVFAIWCKKLGLNEAEVVSTASRALGVVLGGRLTRMPPRVAMAAAFWMGVRACGEGGWQKLKRVEEACGVPGKVILAVEAKMGRHGRKARPYTDTSTGGVARGEEGWAESTG